MESVGTNKSKRTTTSGTHRVWKSGEVKILMDVLKELVATGQWKSENGFRNRYLQRLETMLKDKIENCDIRAIPHIQFRITQWKRCHVALQTALRDSGGGFKTETMILDVSDVVWDKAVQREPTIAAMRYKPWPLYYDWIEVFDNDGATGGCSQTVNDVVDEMAKEDAGHGGCGNEPSDANNAPEQADEPVAMDVESEAPNIQDFPPTGPASPNKSASKSPPRNNKELLDGLAVLFKASDDHLDDIVHTIVAQPQPQPQPQAGPTILSRSQVFNIVETIPELTLDQALDAAENISMNANRLEKFSGLPKHARLRYVHRLLDGDFDKPV